MLSRWPITASFRRATRWFTFPATASPGQALRPAPGRAGRKPGRAFSFSAREKSTSREIRTRWPARRTPTCNASWYDRILFAEWVVFPEEGRDATTQTSHLGAIASRPSHAGRPFPDHGGDSLRHRSGDPAREISVAHLSPGSRAIDTGSSRTPGRRRGRQRGQYPHRP